METRKSGLRVWSVNLADGRIRKVTGSRGLIGRDADLMRVGAVLLRDGRCTLVGPGGVGKSRLARAVADGSARRTLWIDAEPLPDVDALAEEVLRQLGQERLPGESPLEAAASALDGAELLLVLDGVEHLGAQFNGAVGTLPIGVDGPWLLVTSRHPLGPSLRPLVKLEPLPTTGVDSPAGQLLMFELDARGIDAESLAADPERWRRVLAATGGLPAAILLTADYVARFGAELDDERPVPIEAIIERCLARTLALLTSNERRAFVQLGLTAGPFTLDLVSGLTGEPAAEARKLVGRLVEHGLVIVGDDRFDLLPPIRDGARDLLDHDGPASAAALDSALAWALGVAGSDTTEAEAAVGANLDTVLGVARLALADPALHPGVVPLVHALFDPMYRRLRWRELLSLLETMATNSTLSPRDQAETALLAAHCAGGCDTIAHARRWLDQAHQIASCLDDPLLQARAWGADAWLSLDVGDHGRAFDAAGRSMRLSGGHTDLELAALRVTAETALASGDLDRAESVARDVLARTTGQTSFDALLARSTIGWCLVERGKYAEAVAHAKLLAADSRRDHGEVSETSVEAELIALAANPHTEPQAPLLDDQRFSWWMRLEQRIRLTARIPIEQGWETVLLAAADIIVLAGQVPLAHPRIEATILLGDAALAGGDLRQALQAYEQALRDAVRAPSRLRAADALDGIAALAPKTGQHELARMASATAAAIRADANAVPWTRPTLPGPAPAPPSHRPPTGWLRDGQLTTAAVDELTQAIRLVKADAEPWATLTHAEREIARLVRRGLSNAEIADELVISRRTVESHLSRIFRKLSIRSRTQLATLPPAAFRQ